MLRSLLILITITITLFFALSAMAKTPRDQFIESVQGTDKCRIDNVAIVVHGTKSNHEHMSPLGNWLNGQGYCTIYFEYGENQRLSNIASTLSLKLAALVRDRSLNKLLVVAHSMGGLVSRKALTESYWHRYKIEIPVTFISIASPFAGFEQANKFNSFLYFFGRFFGAKKTYLEIGSKREFMAKAGPLHAGVRHYKIETIESGWRNTIDGETFNDDILTLQQQRQPEVDSSLEMRTQLDIGHNSCINHDGEISAQLELTLSQILGLTYNDPQ